MDNEIFIMMKNLLTKGNAYPLKDKYFTYEIINLENITKEKTLTSIYKVTDSRFRDILEIIDDSTFKFGMSISESLISPSVLVCMHITTNNVHLLIYAKEGLIKQGMAKKAIKRIKEAFSIK